MRRLAGEFAAEADRGRQSRYVQLFLRMKDAPFPADPALLLSLIRQTDDEKLAWQAVLGHTPRSVPPRWSSCA